MEKSSEVIIKKDFVIRKETLVAKKNCLSAVYKHYSLDGGVYLGEKHSYERKNADKSSCSIDVDYDKNGKITRVLETGCDRYGNVSEKIMIQNGKIDVRYTQVNRYKGKSKPVSKVKYYQDGRPQLKTCNLYEKSGRLSRYQEVYSYKPCGVINYKLLDNNRTIRNTDISILGELIADNKFACAERKFLNELLAKSFDEILNQSKNVRSLEDYCNDSVTSLNKTVFTKTFTEQQKLQLV